MRLCSVRTRAERTESRARGVGRERWRREGQSCAKGPQKGWALMGRTAGGGGAAILSPRRGGGAGSYWSVLPLHWLPSPTLSPTLSEEPEQCWQICLHVFIIIKNMKGPSSLKAQQITFSLSPPSAELWHSLSFSSTLARSPTPPQACSVGDPSLPFSELSGPCGFLMTVGSFRAALGGSS